MHRATVFLFLLSVLLILSGSSSPQTRGLPLPSTPPTEDNGPPVPSRVQREMEKKANAQRQADLKRDTEKLLKLSTELKEYVDKSNENVLSVDVIKRAEEIEKLAHSVKVKMKGDF